MRLEFQTIYWWCNNKIKIESITEGGARDYLPLSEYKKLTTKVRQESLEDARSYVTNDKFLFQKKDMMNF